jgi:hypothetical protein
MSDHKNFENLGKSLLGTAKDILSKYLPRILNSKQSISDMATEAIRILQGNETITKALKSAGTKLDELRSEITAFIAEEGEKMVFEFSERLVKKILASPTDKDAIENIRKLLKKKNYATVGSTFIDEIIKRAEREYPDFFEFIRNSKKRENLQARILDIIIRQFEVFDFELAKEEPSNSLFIIDENGEDQMLVPPNLIYTPTTASKVSDEKNGASRDTTRSNNISAGTNISLRAADPGSSMQHHPNREEVAFFAMSADSPLATGLTKLNPNHAQQNGAKYQNGSNQNLETEKVLRTRIAEIVADILEGKYQNGSTDIFNHIVVKLRAESFDITKEKLKEYLEEELVKYADVLKAFLNEIDSEQKSIMEKRLVEEKSMRDILIQRARQHGNKAAEALFYYFSVEDTNFLFFLVKGEDEDKDTGRPQRKKPLRIKLSGIKVLSAPLETILYESLDSWYSNRFPMQQNSGNGKASRDASSPADSGTPSITVFHSALASLPPEPLNGVRKNPPADAGSASETDSIRAALQEVTKINEAPEPPVDDLGSPERKAEYLQDIEAAVIKVRQQKTSDPFSAVIDELNGKGIMVGENALRRNGEVIFEHHNMRQFILNVMTRLFAEHRSDKPILTPAPRQETYVHPDPMMQRAERVIREVLAKTQYLKTDHDIIDFLPSDNACELLSHKQEEYAAFKAHFFPANEEPKRQELLYLIARIQDAPYTANLLSEMEKILGIDDRVLHDRASSCLSFLRKTKGERLPPDHQAALDSLVAKFDQVLATVKSSALDQIRFELAHTQSYEEMFTHIGAVLAALDLNVPDGDLPAYIRDPLREAEKEFLDGISKLGFDENFLNMFREALASIAEGQIRNLHQRLNSLDWKEVLQVWKNALAGLVKFDLFSGKPKQEISQIKALLDEIEKQPQDDVSVAFQESLREKFGHMRKRSMLDKLRPYVLAAGLPAAVGVLGQDASIPAITHHTSTDVQTILCDSLVDPPPFINIEITPGSDKKIDYQDEFAQDAPLLHKLLSERVLTIDGEDDQVGKAIFRHFYDGNVTITPEQRADLDALMEKFNQNFKFYYLLLHKGTKYKNIAEIVKKNISDKVFLAINSEFFTILDHGLHDFDEKMLAKAQVEEWQLGINLDNEYELKRMVEGVMYASKVIESILAANPDLETINRVRPGQEINLPPDLNVLNDAYNCRKPVERIGKPAPPAEDTQTPGKSGSLEPNQDLHDLLNTHDNQPQNRYATYDKPGQNANSADVLDWLDRHDAAQEQNKAAAQSTLAFLDKQYAPYDEPKVAWDDDAAFDFAFAESEPQPVQIEKTTRFAGRADFDAAVTDQHRKWTKPHTLTPDTQDIDDAWGSVEEDANIDAAKDDYPTLATLEDGWEEIFRTIEIAADTSNAASNVINFPSTRNLKRAA